MSARLAIAAAVLAGATAAARGACAQPCPLPVGADARLAAVDGTARLQWIDGRLARTAHRTKVWRYSITAGLVAATIGNLIPVAFVSKDERIDWYTGSATTVIGIVPLYLQRLAVLDDAPAVHLDLETLARAAGAGDVCLTLAHAEERLAQDAANQYESQRWWWHVGNVLVNAGVGLFLGLGFHHWKAGVFNFVSGAVIGEAIILTQPTDSVEDLANYRAGNLGLPARTLSFTVSRSF